MTWPILFPLNATGGGGQVQLDVLSYSNVDVTKSSGKNRLYAHALLGWLFYGFIMYMILRECIFYINLRQAFLLSPLYAKRISSRTVLFTSVPTPYLDEARIRKIFSDSVKRVWITADTEKLDKLVEERDKVAMKLEGAEVKLIKLANAERLKAIKKGASSEKPAEPLDAESGSVAGRWIPKKKRPTHRTGALGLVGAKVDTIDWCRTELQRLIPLVEAAQAEYRAGGSKKIPGVFVEFYTQSDAQAAYQVLSHHQALHMTPKYIGITPGEIVWASLKLPWWQKVVRRFAVIAFIAALIIFWAIPVSIVGVISQVSYLKTLSFLTWLDKVPNVIMGVITGLLPAVALAILMSLVPIIMRCKHKSFLLRREEAWTNLRQCVPNLPENRPTPASNSLPRTPISASSLSRCSWSQRSPLLRPTWPFLSLTIPAPSSKLWPPPSPRRPTSTFRTS
jgi:calcium permeable stress-gated cation channel